MTLLAEQAVEASEQVEQLSAEISSGRGASAMERQQFQVQLDSAWREARLAQQQTAAIDRRQQEIQAELDRVCSERTRLRQQLSNRDELLSESNARGMRLEEKLQRSAAGHIESTARRQPEQHAVAKSRRRVQEPAFTSVQRDDEQITALARRVYVEPLRRSERRAAEAIEERRRALSDVAVHQEQQRSAALQYFYARGYRIENDPLACLKVQELQAEHEFAREQRLHGRHGRAQLIQPGTDLGRLAVIWALEARQRYSQDPPPHRYGTIYWQQEGTLLDDESEQDLANEVAQAIFKWRKKLYRYR